MLRLFPKYNLRVPNKILEKVKKDIMCEETELVTETVEEYYTQIMIEVKSVRGLDKLNSYKEVTKKPVLDRTSNELKTDLNNLKLSIANSIQMLEAIYGVNVKDLSMKRHSQSGLTDHIFVGFTTEIN